MSLKQRHFLSNDGGDKKEKLSNDILLEQKKLESEKEKEIDQKAKGDVIRKIRETRNIKNLSFGLISLNILIIKSHKEYKIR